MVGGYDGEPSDQKLRFHVTAGQSQVESQIDVLPSKFERADFFQNTVLRSKDTDKLIIFGVYFVHEIDLASPSL